MKQCLLLVSALIILLSVISCDLIPTGTNPPSPPDKPVNLVLRDYEFADRKVFDLALPSDNLKASDVITKLIMFESVPSYNADVITTIANFYVDPNDTSLFKSESIQENFTKVKIIPPDKYTIWDDTVRDLHYIVFDSRQSRNINLGYYMEVKDTIGNIRKFGNLEETYVIVDTSYNYIIVDTISLYHLKLLYPADWTYPTPLNQTWQLMWRNCYEIPKGIALQYMNMRVYKGVEGTEDSLRWRWMQFDGTTGTSYNAIFGLNSNFYFEIYRPDWGLLIFPSRKPFNDTVRYSIEDRVFPELELKVPELYDYTSWSERIESSQYFIRFEWLEY